MNKGTFITELAVRTGRPVTEVRRFVDDFLHLPLKYWHVKKKFYFYVSDVFIPASNLPARCVTLKRVPRSCSTSAPQFALNPVKIFSQQ